MDNFNLREYLTEGRLLKEVISVNDRDVNPRKLIKALRQGYLFELTDGEDDFEINWSPLGKYYMVMVNAEITWRGTKASEMLMQLPHLSTLTVSFRVKS